MSRATGVEPARGNLSRGMGWREGFSFPPGAGKNSGTKPATKPLPAGPALSTTEKPMKRSFSLMARPVLAGGALVWLALAGAAIAHEMTVGDLQFIHPHIPAPIAAAKTAAGYMAISNDGTAADRLIGIEAGFAAKATLHTTEFSAEGVARMMPVETLEIAPGDTAVLEPGGLHVMLMGLRQKLTPGEMLPATLIFEQGGRVEIEFMVVNADGSVDHSTMEH